MPQHSIDQNIFLGELGITQWFYCPRPRTTEHIELFHVLTEKWSGLLTARTLDNCFITYYHF